MINNTEKLRKYNTIKILDQLKKVEYGTKNSIAEATGLSIATCFNILKDQIEDGRVLEIELAKPTGGRPSRRFKFNYNYSVHLHMYIKSENKYIIMYHSIKNLKGKILQEENVSLKEFSYGDIEKVINKASNKYQNLETFTLSIPGVVKNGYVHSCDIESLEKLNLNQMIKDKFYLDVRIENDVNTLAYGSLANGSAEIASPTVYLYFPSNRMPGMGIIVNNQVILGYNNFAGEVKNLPITSSNLTAEAIQKNSKLFINYITDIVKSVNAVINPGLITISSSNQSNDFNSKLREELIKIEKIGRVKFEEDIHYTMLDGLSYLSDLLIQEV